MKYFVKNQGKIYGPIEEEKIAMAVHEKFFSFNCLLSSDRQEWRLFQQVMPEAARRRVVTVNGGQAVRETAAPRQNQMANPGVVPAQSAVYPDPAPATKEKRPGEHNKRGRSQIILAIIGTAVVLLACFIPCCYMFAGAGNSGDDFRQVYQNYQRAVGLVTVVFEDSDGKLLTGKVGSFTLKPAHTIGTAFAIGPKQFATNCHVAYGVKDRKEDLISSLLKSLVIAAAKKDGVKDEAGLKRYIQRHAKEIKEVEAELKQRVRIRKVEIRLAHSDGKALTVAGVQIHPRYNAKASVQEEYRNGEYDVAILHTSESTDVYFELADKKTLYSLSGGQKIAYIGFPMEGLADSGNLDIDKPEAIFKDGSINKITDFNNRFAKPEANRSIIHDLPAAGGASGSPIFLGNGKVIAILWGVSHSGRNNRGRVASAVQHNMAVRIDALDVVRKEEVYRITDWTGDNKK